MKFEDDREILIYAFRYALGRMTYSTLTVSNEIINNWDEISLGDQQLFQKEIKEAIEENRAGMDCDVASWMKVLELPLKTIG